MKLIIISVCLIFVYSSCSSPSNNNDLNVGVCQQKPLYEYSTFKIGTAVNINKLFSNNDYKSIVDSNFNSITPENAMKFGSLSPSEGIYDWTEADKLVDYAVSMNKSIHGHTLIWHNQLPDWISGITGNEASWDSLMKSHIMTVVGRYKGKIRGWDVVNEAFDDAGTGIRKTIWYNNLGRSYIAKAFKYASEADPDAKLFYNDFSLEYPTHKLDSVINLCESIRGQGIKVDGIGFQMHCTLQFLDSASLVKAIKKVVDKGYLIHFSELDVSVNSSGQNPEYTSAIADKQKEAFRLIALCYNKFVPANLQYGITMWEFSDADSWISGSSGYPNFPCIYDKSYKPKPSLCGFIEGLDGN